MFVSFLYMFWKIMCPSSGETTVFVRHLALVILYGWLSGMQGEIQVSQKYSCTHDLSRRAEAGRSPAEILGSIPTGGMDICLLWVSCVVR